MPDVTTDGELFDVPSRVFTKFLDTLAEKQLPGAVVERLREVLIEKNSHSESELRGQS